MNDFCPFGPSELECPGITTAFPEQLLEEINHHFAVISGLPVIDSDHKCIGVLSKKNRGKVPDLKAKVKDVMTSPAITLFANKIVSDAAVLMLKNKIHRIPIVNDSNQVVGIVTRTDIFSAMEGGKGSRLCDAIVCEWDVTPAVHIVMDDQLSI